MAKDCKSTDVSGHGPRVSGIDETEATSEMRKVFAAQHATWGKPLINHRIYARRPSIFRGVRAMWTGLGSSGLLDDGLVYMLNRRVALLNGCHF